MPPSIKDCYYFITFCPLLQALLKNPAKNQHFVLKKCGNHVSDML